MSDHWEFYPCQMGDDRAFIFYDHGINETLNSVPLPNALRIRVAFDDPTDEGMPKDAEFRRLSKLEDLLATAVSEANGIYVGRITVAGARHFHFFVSLPETAAEELVERIQEEGGYSLQFFVEPDPEKKAYWEELFPSPADWRVIQDMRVLDALKKEGDDSSIARRVDHWLNFPHVQQRDRAAEWAESNGFSIESLSDPNESSREYGLHIFHVSITELEEITAATILLQEKAEDFGGSYDGWETRVEKPEEQ